MTLMFSLVLSKGSGRLVISRVVVLEVISPAALIFL